MLSWRKWEWTLHFIWSILIEIIAHHYGSKSNNSSNTYHIISFVFGDNSNINYCNDILNVGKTIQISSIWFEEFETFWWKIKCNFRGFFAWNTCFEIFICEFSFLWFISSILVIFEFRPPKKLKNWFKSDLI